MGGGGCPGCSCHLALQSSQALPITINITITITITIIVTITNNVLAIWFYSLRRLHTVWERTLNYTQVDSRERAKQECKSFQYWRQNLCLMAWNMKISTEYFHIDDGCLNQAYGLKNENLN